MADITAGSVKSKKKKKISIFPIVNCIIMVLFVIITLYPVLNTLAISLNDGTDALRGGIYLLPRKFTWKNYITVLQKDNLITGAYITVARTIIGTVLALVANAILAFIISRNIEKCCRCSYTYLSSCRSNNYNNASDHMYLPVFTEILCYRTYTWWS